MPLRTLALRRKFHRTRAVRIGAGLLALACAALIVLRDGVPESPAREAAEALLAREAPVAAAAPDPDAVRARAETLLAQVATARGEAVAALTDTAGDAAPAAPTSADPACGLRVGTTDLAAALVALDVEAPCDGGARAVLRQGDLELAVALDARGRAAVEMPLLTDEARIAVTVPGRAPITVSAVPRDLGRYDRAVLAWRGPGEAQLHVYEGGAGRDAPGHLRPAAPRTIAHALSGTGGYLSTLGDRTPAEARRATVYTAPRGTMASLGVEIPVTPATCGRVFEGVLIAPGAAEGDALSLAMPPCTEAGGVIVLDGLLRIGGTG